MLNAECHFIDHYVSVHKDGEAIQMSTATNVSVLRSISYTNEFKKY